LPDEKSYSNCDAGRRCAVLTDYAEHILALHKVDQLHAIANRSPVPRTVQALLFDADAYLLELVRYVHLNPVWAGTTATAAEYPWSGHRGYLGTEQIQWLTTEIVLSMFSTRIEKVQQNVEREYTLEEVVRAVCDHYRTSPEQLRAPGKARPMAEARGVAAAIVQESSHLRLTDLAKLLRRDNSAHSKAARRLTVDNIVRDIAGGIGESEGKLIL